MVELLAACLPRDFLAFEASEEDTPAAGPAKGGELLIAMDPSRFVPEGDGDASLDHAETLFARLLGQEGARLPSDRRYAARLRTPTEGVRIPKQLYDDILSLTA
jgi:LDH2 family malate/lactate/ureidoglycolate dehydrogenase